MTCTIQLACQCVWRHSGRVEVLCVNCHSHLGHVFEGEGYPTPTDQRSCINSISLRLVPKE